MVEPFAAVIARYERIVHTYGPLLGMILLSGLGGVMRVEGLRRRRHRLAWSRRAGSMMPWVTGMVLLVFPIAAADFDYRYLLPVLPFACLAAGLAFGPGPCPARGAGARAPARRRAGDDLTRQVPGRVG